MMPTEKMIDAGESFVLRTKLTDNYTWRHYARDLYICMQSAAPQVPAPAVQNESFEALASQLLTKRAKILGRPLTWAEAIEITAIVTSMPDEEKQRLLDMDDAPAVQGEPVGWQFYQDGKWWHGYERIKDHRKNTEEAGFPVRDLYATPQPAEQQTAPDVAGLIGKVRMLIATGNRLSAEAQECTYDDGAAEVASVDFWGEFRDALEAATEALDTHRKQGGDV